MAKRRRSFDEAYEIYETGRITDKVKCDECGHICMSDDIYCGECGNMLSFDMDENEIDNMDSDSEVIDDEEDINAEFEQDEYDEDEERKEDSYDLEFEDEFEDELED